jgi:hypothetical protein
MREHTIDGWWRPGVAQDMLLRNMLLGNTGRQPSDAIRAKAMQRLERPPVLGCGGWRRFSKIGAVSQREAILFRQPD